MRARVKDKEAGWREWLHRFGLWGEDRDEDANYLRYRQFKNLDLGVVPEAERGPYYRDLLPLERGLVFGDAIGLVEEFPFRFQVGDDTPIRQRPIGYSFEEREWIREYMAAQEKLGIVRKVLPGEVEPKFVVGVVLVKEGQSQQKYRLCANLIQPNTRVEPSAQPLVACAHALDELQGLELKSALDIKAGYFNIPLAPGMSQYAGLVTQDALYTFQRMAFGYSLAPGFFQAVMSIVMGRGRPLRAGIYLDDCTIGGGTVEGCWADTLEGMKRLLAAGLPLNVGKLKLLQRSVPVLGVVLADEQFQLGKKALAKAFATTLPRSLLELQRLLGRFNFASQFCPDYHRVARPLVALASPASGGRWRQEHTDALNALGELVWRRLKLALVNPSEPLSLHVDVSDGDLSAVLTQGEGETYRLVGFGGRALAIQEAACSRTERLLLAALWAIKRWARYTQFTPQLTVVLPDAVDAAVTKSKDPPLRLQARLVELSAVGAKFTTGKGAWGLLENLKQSMEPPPAGEEPVEKPVWTHQDIDLEYPSTRPEAVDVEGAWVLHFDGGCRSGMGSGGCLLWDPDGRCHMGFGWYFGRSQPSNNMAEAQAMLRALQVIRAGNWVEHRGTLLVRGDSNLTIGFMTKQARPGKKELVVMVKEAQQLMTGWGRKVRFQWVPREENKFADWLANVAFFLEADTNLVELQELQARGELPVPAPGQLQGPGVGLGVAGVDRVGCYMDPGMIGVVIGVEGEMEVCQVCGSEEPSGRLLRCGACGVKKHPRCAEKDWTRTRAGPWQCKECRRKLIEAGNSDLLVDEALLRYLSHREAPTSAAAYQRVVQASSYLRLDREGRLWTTGPGGGPPRLVPDLVDRKPLLEKLLQELGHPGGDRLFQAARLQYYWRGMKEDCFQVAKACLGRRLEAAKFPPPSYLHPAEKPAAPFRVWCLDSAVNFTPPAPDGATDVILAVDPFTKWVEIGTVPVLNSREVAEWFHREVVCRYGVPARVRTDQGREYLGAFDTYLRANGIRHSLIATNNPRANGQVERYVRTMKQGIRTFMGACEGGRWWECLGDVARGMRVIPARSTGFSPHFVVFKQPPVLPLVAELRVSGEDYVAEIGQEECAQLVGIWEDLYQEVRVRQRKYDAKMLEQYQQRSDLAEYDVRFIFSPGDMVLLKQREKGKMKTRSTGPHTFVRYEGKLGTVAVILITPGRELKVSAGNLLPVDSHLAQRRHVSTVFPEPNPPTATPARGKRRLEVEEGSLPAAPDMAQPHPPPVQAEQPATTTSTSLGISFGEPSSLPSGVRVVPAPRAPGNSEDEAEGPAAEDLPLGEHGRLPWRDYARGGQGLRDHASDKEGGKKGGKLRATGAVRKRGGRKG